MSRPGMKNPDTVMRSLDTNRPTVSLTHLSRLLKLTQTLTVPVEAPLERYWWQLQGREGAGSFVGSGK